MEPKHLLDDMATSPRPNKRRTSSSPASHLPSTPDNYETSSQPTPMGNEYSYFSYQQTPSEPSERGSPPPGVGGGVLGSEEDGHYTTSHDLDMRDGSPPAAAASSGRQGAGPQQGGVPIPIDPALDQATHLPIDSPQQAQELGDHDFRLMEMTAEEREGFYSDIWKDQTIELKDLTVPPICSEFPNLANEILSAYLYYITVTAKVWSNYDSATKDFFWEPRNRYNDTGKLYLTPNQRRRLQSLDPNLFQMMHVRLDVGTPFRTLFEIHIRSIENEELGGCNLIPNGVPQPDPNYPHTPLRELSIKAMRQIKEAGLPEANQVGLTLHDLDEIAKDFVMKPSLAPHRQRTFQREWFW